MLDTELASAYLPEVAPSVSHEVSRPAARTLADLVRSQLVTLRMCHAAVLRTDAVEAIHKMRVTTRRLQASLDLLQTGPMASEVKKIKRRLRKCRRMLSEVRNYDVFLALIDKEASSRPLVQREQFELLHAILQKRRSRRAAEIRNGIERLDADAVASRLGITLPPIQHLASALAPENEPTTDDRFEVEAAEQMPNLNGRAKERSKDKSATIDERAVAARTAGLLEQRLAEFQLLASQTLPTDNPIELHQLRIAAKRLRYLMEITSDLGYGSATAALVYLRSLQDRIGDWHDLQALEEEIVGIVTRPKFVRKNLAESSIMLRAAAHLQKRKQRLVSRLFPVRIPKTVAATSERLAKSLRRPQSLEEIDGRHSEVGGQKSEVGGQRSEVRDQRSEIRDQRSEVRGQKSEVRDQKSEIRDQRSEVRDQRSEVRDQKSEVRDQASHVGDQESEIRDRRSEASDF